ncbi:hypothetical protein F5Y12DRAFT_761384 [Xylaria sp. FL1777]|nr:hypothetical protein F5Y12DRAFT_761384 [Xylaria sp. FL1777]
MIDSQGGVTLNPTRQHSCLLCQKTFEHEASTKRHHYYCRSKPDDTKGSRKRSCSACVRAKARCLWRADVGLDGCLRCNKRGVTCEYDTTTIRRKVPGKACEDTILAVTIQTGRNDSGEGSSTTLGSTRSPSHNETTLFNASDHAYLAMGTATESSFLDSINVTFDDLIFDIENLPYREVNSMSVACSKIAKLSSTITSPPSPWAYHLSKTPFFSIRDFTRPDHVALKTVAMRILRSYPSMMLVKGTLPPFIHSSVYARPMLDDAHKEHQSLVTCWNLVRSFKTQTGANKSSWVWGQIWHEQERILAEYSSFDRWELLDALQALLVFCLLRLHDVPVGHAVFDVSLLTTVNLVSRALRSSVEDSFDCTVSQDPALARRDWIFLESRRRTVLIFQIVGLLVDISTAVSYFSIGGLVLVPLPSASALWDTQNFEKWKPEYRKWHGEHTIYGLSDTGCLTRLQTTGDGIMSSTVEWEGWSAEVGDIATLVMVIGELLKSQ